MFIPRYYEDLNTLHVGCEPNRSYFIPRRARSIQRSTTASTPTACSCSAATGSSATTAASTTLMPRVTAADAAYAPRFFDVDFDTAADYATLPVPSVWQMHGYDHNQYTNTRYPFPLDPPYVPADNPCAVYRRTFDYTPSESAPRAYLNFEGRGQLFLCVAQRRVHRLFAGLALHERIRRDRAHRARRKHARGARAQMVRRQLSRRSGQTAHERHLPRCHICSRVPSA